MRRATKNKRICPSNLSNAYTTQVLARLGHFWPAIGEDYVRRFVAVLKDLVFFETT